MRKFSLLLLLAVAIFAAYAPALRNEFVWDDTALVLRDPLIRSWRLIPEGFHHFLFIDATASDFYRPIQRLSYTMDYAAFAFRPLGYHVTSIGCHVGAAIALYFFAAELLAYLGVAERARRLIPFCASLAWALHPLHTSAVAYISGRADPLAAAFGFLGLFLGLRSLRARGIGLWGLTLGAGAALLLSSLSKEAGLIFLAVWLVILGFQKDWKALLRASVVVLFVIAIYGSLRLPAEHIPPPVTREPTPFLVRPILVARVFAEYTWLVLFPGHLQMDRDVETHPWGFADASMSASAWKELQTLAGIVLIAAFLYWMNRERKRDHAVFICLLLALVVYLPVSGIIPLNANLAEHWLYLPTAFLFLGIALAAARFLQSAPARMHLWRSLIVSIASVWILCFAGRTFMQTFDWKDQRTFLERTVAKGGDSVRMLINLGGLELSEGRLEEAKKHLQLALTKEPDHPLAVINLAAVAVKENDFARAHQLLARAEDMPLVEAQAHELLAVLESKESGRANIRRMHLATRSGPSNWAIEKRYVRLLDETGATDAAIVELKRCLTTQWYRADTWQLLSELEQKAGRLEAAATANRIAHLYDVHLDAKPPRS